MTDENILFHLLMTGKKQFTVFGKKKCFENRLVLKRRLKLINVKMNLIAWNNCANEVDKKPFARMYTVISLCMVAYYSKYM